MKDCLTCPHCGKDLDKYRNPFPTVDIILELYEGIILIQRKNPPYGWALPGGFVDYGESLEQAAAREVREETSLDIENLSLFGVYSDPERDPRHHSISIVFRARANGQPRAGDDAIKTGIFNQDNLPANLMFDHGRILKDYFTKCPQKK